MALGFGGLLLLVGAAAEPTTKPADLGAVAANLNDPADIGRPPDGITEPWRRTKYNLRSGIVRKVFKEHGDRVKEGEELLVLKEEAEEQAKLEIYKAEAESNVPIEAAKAKQAAAKVKLDRMKKIFDSGGGNDSEYEEAVLEHKVAGLEIEKAKMEQVQKQLQVKYQEAVLKSMRVVSEFDGIVEEVNVREGEMANPQAQEGSIVVVKNDPLRVVVWLPAATAQTIKVGQQLAVVYPGESERHMAEVYFRSPVVQAMSGMQLLRLKLPNPEGRDAGMKVQVMLPGGRLAAAAGQ